MEKGQCLFFMCFASVSHVFLKREVTRISRTVAFILTLRFQERSSYWCAPTDDLLSLVLPVGKRECSVLHVGRTRRGCQARIRTMRLASNLLTS